MIPEILENGVEFQPKVHLNPEFFILSLDYNSLKDTTLSSIPLRNFIELGKMHPNPRLDRAIQFNNFYFENICRTLHFSI